MQPEVIALIITLVSVILFVTEWVPSVVTACLACMLMALTGASSFQTAFSGFSNSIIFLMFGALVVGNAMFDTGAAQIIGRQVVRLSKDNERLFVFVSSLVAGVLAMFLANTAVIAAFLPIIDSVCRASSHMNRKNLTLPMAMSAMFGGASTLIGCTPQLTANGILDGAGLEQMGMWTLTGPGLCLFGLFLLFTQVYGYRLGKKIWGDRPDETMNIDKERLDAATRTDYDKKKIIMALMIVAVMILFYVTEWLSTAMTAMLAAVACILTGCTNTESIRKNMNWDVVIFLAACLGLAGALTESGAGDLISNSIADILGPQARSPILVFALLVLLVTVISNFITNSTAIIIVLPIALSVCSIYGYNTMPFTLGVTFGASLACSTPLAASQITMTLVSGYHFSDYTKYTLLLDVIIYIGILVFVPLFYPLV